MLSSLFLSRLDMRPRGRSTGGAMSTTNDTNEFSLGDWDPYSDTRALERMAIYDNLRAKGDAFFSERFEGFWIMTRAERMREVLQNPQLFSSTASQPSDPHPAYAWIPL